MMEKYECKSAMDIPIKIGEDFSFARDVTTVPLTAVEFRNAAVEFPIVFAEAGDDVVPVVLMGLPTQQNLYVGEDGALKSLYIPAFFHTCINWLLCPC